MKVSDVIAFIDSVAPFDTQESYDNSGLLTGHPEQEISRVLFALDVTNAVLNEAEALGANLIVTHHPLMFDAVKTLREDNREAALLCRMIRLGISMIAVHTPLDKAPGGTNDTLAALLGLTALRGEGYVRVGDLPTPITAGELQVKLEKALGDKVRLMGDPTASCRTLGLCTGSGSSEWPDAATLGADSFLTGEVKHNRALEMADQGIPVFECGHFATEQPGIFALADTLQNHCDALQCNVCVFRSKAGAYRPFCLCP